MEVDPGLHMYKYTHAYAHTCTCMYMCYFTYMHTQIASSYTHINLTTKLHIYPLLPPFSCTLTHIHTYTHVPA